MLPLNQDGDCNFGRNLTTRAMRLQVPGKSLPVPEEVGSLCKAEQLAVWGAQCGEMRSSPTPLWVLELGI